MTIRFFYGSIFLTLEKVRRLLITKALCKFFVEQEAA